MPEKRPRERTLVSKEVSACCTRATKPMLSSVFSVSETEAAAIRAAYERGGELAAVVEVRWCFPGITDNAQAREIASIIASWKPLPALPRVPRMTKAKLHG